MLSVSLENQDYGLVTNLNHFLHFYSMLIGLKLDLHDSGSVTIHRNDLGNHGFDINIDSYITVYLCVAPSHLNADGIKRELKMHKVCHY